MDNLIKFPDKPKGNKKLKEMSDNIDTLLLDNRVLTDVEKAGVLMHRAIKYCIVYNLDYRKLFDYIETKTK